MIFPMVGKNNAIAKRIVWIVLISKIFLVFSTNTDWWSENACASRPKAHEATISIVNFAQSCNIFMNYVYKTKKKTSKRTFRLTFLASKSSPDFVSRNRRSLSHTSLTSGNVDRTYTKKKLCTNKIFLIKLSTKKVNTLFSISVIDLGICLAGASLGQISS